MLPALWMKGMPAACNPAVPIFFHDRENTAAGVGFLVVPASGSVLDDDFGLSRADEGTGLFRSGSSPGMSLVRDDARIWGNGVWKRSCRMGLEQGGSLLVHGRFGKRKRRRGVSDCVFEKRAAKGETALNIRARSVEALGSRPLRDMPFLSYIFRQQGRKRKMCLFCFLTFFKFPPCLFLSWLQRIHLKRKIRREGSIA